LQKYLFVIFLLPTSGKNRFLPGLFFPWKNFFSIQRQKLANPGNDSVNETCGKCSKTIGCCPLTTLSLSPANIVGLKERRELTSGVRGGSLAENNFGRF